MIALLANPDHSRHRAEGHPERPERVTAILDAIAADRGLTPEPAPSVPDALLHRVHDPQYVAMLDRAAASGGGYLDPDTYITPDSMVAARTGPGSRFCVNCSSSIWTTLSALSRSPMLARSFPSGSNTAVG